MISLRPPLPVALPAAAQSTPDHWLDCDILIGCCYYRRERGSLCDDRSDPSMDKRLYVLLSTLNSALSLFELTIS
jgi:hypothetical protein